MKTKRDAGSPLRETDPGIQRCAARRGARARDSQVERAVEKAFERLARHLAWRGVVSLSGAARG